LLTLFFSKKKQSEETTGQYFNRSGRQKGLGIQFVVHTGHYKDRNHGNKSKPREEEKDEPEPRRKPIGMAKVIKQHRGYRYNKQEQ